MEKHTKMLFPAGGFLYMEQFEKIFDFQNLYKAHKVARLGKRDTKEVINFELDLSENLSKLSESLKNKTYKMSGYYSFYVHDPKERKIHALHYVDRVVQHCLCDEVLSHAIEKRLIYDNAACRIGKGTRFALNRVTSFMCSYFKRNGANGYFLKCDIRKFFDSIDHLVLKEKLRTVFDEPELLWLLDLIIDSFETLPGKGIPMGNQTSQWFAVFYLDGFDRIIKEKMQIKFYSRYMDDAVLIHNDKEYLKKCCRELNQYLTEKCKLEFNSKTCVFPIKNGVDYLGWHLYLNENGKVIRKVRRQTKQRYKNKLRHISESYRNENLSLEESKQILQSYRAYFLYGNTFNMQKHLLRDFVLVRG